jgi:hypothetical protein
LTISDPQLCLLGGSLGERAGQTTKRAAAAKRDLVKENMASGASIQFVK